MIKISIIVPVYNVKKYIRRCVESLIKQTYENIEIILVDDGSNDGSEVLCDQLSREDNRIIVFHKENGGLSEARNYGIVRCSGEYVLLVDSDDYIEKQTCSETLKIALDTGADMVAFREKKVYEGVGSKQIEDKYIETKRVKVLSGKEAGVKYLYGDGLQHSAWSKLYKRWLFDKVMFPKGMLAEDFATTYLYIYYCEKIALYDRRLYFYNIRENSIMTQASLKLVLDVYKSACKKYDFEKVIFPDHRKIVETAYCNCLLKTIARIYNEKTLDPVYEQKDIEEKLKHIKWKYIPASSKCIFLLYIFNRKLYAYIMKKIGLNG